MPDYAWHDVKKVHDFSASNFLATSPNKFLDWEITTLFYSVLHHVDSYLSNAWGIENVLDHDQRKEYVSSFLPTIKKVYLLLYYMSRHARYDSTIGTSELAKAKSYYAQVRCVLTPVLCPKCGYQNLKNIGKCETCGSNLS
jgi:hypothetical protein